MSIPPTLPSSRQVRSRSNLSPIPNQGEYSQYGALLRDPSTISTDAIKFAKVLEPDNEVGEQTVYQVEIENEELLRKSHRSELASKSSCLTRRWQTALVTAIIIVALAAAIGGLAYWIKIPKVITQPYLLYGESCYMNSRSCDETRMLWCPAGTCICTGNYQWNSTAQNCTCGQYQKWTGFKCQDYGYYGDPCNTVDCQPTLTCMAVVNQTYSTGQKICVCDNTTYLSTSTRTCVTKLGFNAGCLTNSDCQSWLGLACTKNQSTSATTCQCSSTSYWNNTLCVQNALGWQPCSVSVPCDTTRGLTCDTITNTCECDSLSYWDNVTTFNCQTKKTYGISCQFYFQCNQTVNLSCSTASTGCNCPQTSTIGICDCAAGTFWDDQQCIPRHVFNGTCPGQYACSSNLVCYLGHCICPGNMAWGAVTAGQCDCSSGVWNTTLNTCI